MQSCYDDPTTNEIWCAVDYDGGVDTIEISRFGSTSCKALYECLACLEPFDYFKVL